MKRIVLSLGSNIDRQEKLGFAVREIRRQFGEVELSPVYETSAVGFEGNPFYNFVLGFLSDAKLSEIIDSLRRIEVAAGRVRGPKTFDNRVLDIDVILYGDENWRDRGFNVPRDEIERYAYVLKPLVDLYPEMIHPTLGVPLQELWNGFEPREQSLFLAEYSPDQALSTDSGNGTELRRSA